MLTRRKYSRPARQQCSVQEFIRGEVVGRVWRGTHAHGVDSLWVQPVNGLDRLSVLVSQVGVPPCKGPAHNRP